MNSNHASRERQVAIERAGLLLTLGVAGFLSAPSLTAGPLILDEHAAFWLADPDVELGITQRSLQYAAVPPLTGWVQSASLRLWGRSERALRLPSPAAYIAGVGLLVLGSRQRLGSVGAVLAGLLLALHPDVVAEVRVGRSYGLVLLGSVLLLVLTLRCQQPTSRVSQGVVWGVAAAALLWTHVLSLPVVALAAGALLLTNIRLTGRVRPATVVGVGTTLLLSLPLLPLLVRLWEWRHALNYQSGTVSVAQALGPFVWLALPAAAVLLLVPPRRRTMPPIVRPVGEGAFAAPVGVSLAFGLLPLLVLLLVSRDDLTSLSQPRYRIPYAVGNVCLLAAILTRPGRPVLAGLAAGVLVTACWLMQGTSPLDPGRLHAPDAPLWKELGQTLERAVQEPSGRGAPVFVQGGLIEGMLVPWMYDDPHFHGYLASRLGRFYAPNPNPRYGLPLLWGSGSRPMAQWYGEQISAASRERRDIYVAVATDTDLNRQSFAEFARLLEVHGYEGTPLAGEELMAMLYRFRSR
jgi:hypothetical protein